MIDRICEQCGVTFQIYPCWDKPGWQRFCGNDCKKAATKAANATPLTLEYLKEILEYHLDTGLFTRRTRIPGRAEIGDIAGTIKPKKPYVVIEIKGRPYAAHRLAWLYMAGEWPKDQVDHIDQNKSNNAWANLREATNGQNKVNTTSTNARKNLRGVRKIRNKFAAYIGPSIYLGLFSTPEEAHEAYCIAGKERYGEFFLDNEKIEELLSERVVANFSMC